MLRKIFTRRRLFTALAVVTLIAAVVVAMGLKNRTSAKPCVSVDTLYYSDATLSEVVGEHYIPCSGSPWSWGTTSPYYETTTESCYDDLNPYNMNCN
jgi:hypothetical protein